MSLIERLLKLVKAKTLEAPAGESAIARRIAGESEGMMVAGLTPGHLSRVLKDAASGSATDFLVLAEQMEELDPHYRSVLATRKLAVAGIEPEIVAASDSAADKEIAAFVREIVDAPTFVELVTDLLDSLGKGYAVCEIEWDTSGNQWKPQAYVWRDPRGFVYDRTSRALMERGEGEVRTALEPFRFVTHIPQLKSGLPVRGALARLAAWSFLFKNYAMKDWMRFVEVYGMPLRLGRYTPNATDDDKRKLLYAVTNIGTDAAAIIPQSMQVEFVQTGAGTAAQGPVFGQFATFLDAQVSKGVLGQTMTTDSGSSRAQAQVHDDVRMDIKAADARQLTMTLMRDLIIPVVALNFGVQKVWPQLRLPVSEPEDITAWTDNAGKMMDRGLDVSQRQVRQKLGLDAPADMKDALKATPKVAGPGPDPAGPGIGKEKASQTAASQAHGTGCPCCGRLAIASKPGGQADEDGMDRLVAEALKAGVHDLDGLIDPVLAIAGRARDYDEFMVLLSSVAGTQDAGALVNRLGPLMFMARGTGDATDDPVA